jgi:aspartate kinase
MKILKFGGKSVGDAANICKVVEVIRSRAQAAPILVFSAMGHTTDALADTGWAASEGRVGEAMAIVSSLREFHGALVEGLLAGRGSGVWSACAPLFDEIEAIVRGLAVLGDFSPPVQDRLLGFGEVLSTLIFCEVLRGEGMPVTWVDAREVVVTDGRHTQAEPIFEATAAKAAEVLLPLVRSGQIPVTQGFIARSSAGAVTTLGRGGSDFTASLLGAALGAEEIEIWTDVDGIMTADPSLVPGAKNIPVMSFQEAAELAFFGARVLHPKTLAPAIERGIPVRVLNTSRPELPGTVIVASSPPGGGPVKSIAYKEGMAVVNLVSARMFKAQGFLRRVFETLDRHRIAPDLVSTSEVSVALAVTPWAHLEAAVDELRGLGAVTVRTGQAVVAVVGDGLKQTPGILGRMFQDLDDVYVAMVSEGGSEVAVSFVVGEGDLPAVVSRLHRRFFETEAHGGA